MPVIFLVAGAMPASSAAGVVAAGAGADRWWLLFTERDCPSEVAAWAERSTQHVEALPVLLGGDLAAGVAFAEDLAGAGGRV